MLLDLGAVVKHHKEQTLVLGKLFDGSTAVEADGVLDENVVAAHSHELGVVTRTNFCSSGSLALH
tara:strand:- start:2094 stop:2288 length:195 start_codon:yes stop_codon:yes gene_type:complete